VVSSTAASPDAYLRELPSDRAAELEIVRATVNTALPVGFVETMDFGMISWVVPLAAVPQTYNGKPLMFAALGAQKNHSSLYLMPLYSGAVIAEAEFRARWSAGRKPDMGKACVRFRKAEDLDLDLIGEVIASCSLDRFVEVATSQHSSR
jgi:hypothetical protein